MNRPELLRRSGAPVSAAQAQKAHGTVAATSRVFTVSVNQEMFGLPIEFVQTIFRVSEITPIPLAPAHIVGLINLRGKVLTAISLRKRLDLPQSTSQAAPFAVCIRYGDEDFALVVDAVHDVVELHEANRLPTPAHVADARARLTASIYDQGNSILPVLNIHATVLAIGAQAA